jgi:hypothetical protein
MHYENREYPSVVINGKYFVSYTSQFFARLTFTISSFCLLLHSLLAKNGPIFSATPTYLTSIIISAHYYLAA